MADLRDSFLAAITAYLRNNGIFQLAAAPASCCPGRIADWPAGCTCWEPVFDLDQTDIDSDVAAITDAVADLAIPFLARRIAGDPAGEIRKTRRLTQADLDSEPVRRPGAATGWPSGMSGS